MERDEFVREFIEFFGIEDVELKKGLKLPLTENARKRIMELDDEGFEFLVEAFRLSKEGKINISPFWLIIIAEGNNLERLLRIVEFAINYNEDNIKLLELIRLNDSEKDALRKLLEKLDSKGSGICYNFSFYDVDTGSDEFRDAEEIMGDVELVDKFVIVREDYDMCAVGIVRAYRNDVVIDSVKCVACPYFMPADVMRAVIEHVLNRSADSMDRVKKKIRERRKFLYGA